MALFANDAFIEDVWRAATPDEAARDHVIFTPTQWRERRAALFEQAGPFGLRLEPGASVSEIGADLARLALIALTFPKYTDGRAYSMARQLRDMGFSGQLRAVGNVLFDQLQLMQRCGFDAFEINHEPTLRLLREGRRPVVSRFYQPGLGAEAPAGTRPWARRLAVESGAK